MRTSSSTCLALRDFCNIGGHYPYVAHWMVYTAADPSSELRVTQALLPRPSYKREQIWKKREKKIYSKHWECLRRYPRGFVCFFFNGFSIRAVQKFVHFLIFFPDFGSDLPKLCLHKNVWYHAQANVHADKLTTHTEDCVKYEMCFYFLCLGDYSKSGVPVRVCKNAWRRK